MRQDPKSPSLAAQSLDLIVIVGPTASGKTELAVALAHAVNGEIISADSRQIYRELDAGTAKPQRDAQGLVEKIPYHLVDCVNLDTPFDAGQFAALARPLAEEIRGRDLTPILAGGTGLYIRAFLEGLSAMPPRDESVRGRLAQEAKDLGPEPMHEKLKAVDPEAAQKIPAGNIHRVIRALEVHELTGRPISSFWGKRPRVPGLEKTVILSLEWPPEALRERITSRAAAMWPGIILEVRALCKRYTGREPGFQSLGYRQALSYLRGEMTLEEGLQELTRSTLAYAKRQRTWFRHQISAQPIEGAPTSVMLAQALRYIK